MKSFLEQEHSPDDDIVVADDWEDEEPCYDEDNREPEDIPDPLPTKKPSLDDRIRSAQAVADTKEKSHSFKAEQLSLF